MLAVFSFRFPSPGKKSPSKISDPPPPPNGGIYPPFPHLLAPYRYLEHLAGYHKFVGNITKKANLKTKVTKKQSAPNFPKNEHSLPPDMYTYLCVSRDKKWEMFVFLDKFGLLCFPFTSGLRFAFLPYYWRITLKHFASIFFIYFNAFQYLPVFAA